MLNQDFSEGFVNPVRDGQAAFRAVLDALANPGTLPALTVPAAQGSLLSAELASIVLSLTDHDTPIWLSPRLADDGQVKAFVGFHTGAPIVSETGKAQFAFVAEGDALPALNQFNLGTQEYPDRSTTIVVALPALHGGPGLTLKGPGIEHSIAISPVGLPEDFVGQWMDNRELFPRGVDLLLVAGGQVLGLPRTSRIVEA